MHRRGFILAALEALFWLLVAGGLWAYSYRFDKYLPNYEFGAVSWPRALLLLLALCALGGVVSRLHALKQRRRPKADPAQGVPHPVGLWNTANTVLWRISAAFILPLIYAWLLPRAGFFATTPFMLSAYMYIFGQRRVLHLVGTMLVIYLAVVLVFSRFLSLPLPTGIWPGFYDFSNALLTLVNTS